jgi:hypothetical protein
MRKISKFLTPLVVLFFSMPAHAVCPVCTVTVGAGLGISRMLGVDDTVVSVWVGGIILSAGFWLADWLKKKNVKVSYLSLISVSAMYFLTIVPLWYTKVIGLSHNKLFGIDKILLGTFIGSVLFLLGMFVDNQLRKRNNGKVYFQFQKVILPVAALMISSLVMFVLTY